MVCLAGLLSHDLLGSLLRLELKVLWHWSPGPVSSGFEARWNPLLVTHQDTSLSITPSFMRQVSSLLDRPSPSQMMSSPAMLMIDRTSLCTTEQMGLCSKIFQNLTCSIKDLVRNHSTSCGRVEPPISV